MKTQCILLLNFIILLSLKAGATVYTVTSTADPGAGAGTSGSLRYCITTANADPAVPHTLTFALPAGPVTIALGSTLPQITRTLNMNATTQPGWSPATGPIVTISGPGFGIGLDFNNAPSSLVTGFILTNFGDPHINVTNSNSMTIQANYIGNNGVAAGPNAYGRGIVLTNSSNSVVGGNIVAAPFLKNVISGRDKGVVIQTTSVGCVIQGNYFGLNAAGNAAMSNGNTAIEVNTGCSNTKIGGSVNGEGNVIGKMTGGHGIMISSNNNLVQGNYVGLDASGTIAMAIATNGLYLYNAWYNTIGGSNATERNIFANCNNYGVLIENGGSKCRSNWLFNNYIGVDKNGNTSQSNNNTGVRIKGASYNFIGWTGANQGNVISSNKDCGVTLEGDCDSNTVAGNYIGLGANGTTVLVNGTSNSHHGIYVQGAGSTYTSIKNNVIVSPGRGAAIKFDNGGFDTLSANYCGTDYTGLVAVGAGTGSSDHVINFANGNVSNVTIVNNVVACGKGDGIRADGVCSNHVLKGNIVGMNKNGLGGTAFGNLGTGIYYSNGATKVNLIIGGVNASDRNIVSSNGRGAPNGCSSTIGYGIIIEQTNGATIQGNYIGVDASGNTAAGNGGSGIMINGGSNNILIGGTVVGARNIVCSNGFNCSGPPANVRHGIQFVSNGTATSMLVQGNYVGIGADGTTLLGNSEEAVSSWQTPNIIIGGNTPAYRNVIAGSDKGVFLQPSSSTGCKIIGNYIGTDASGTLARPNNIGVHIAGPAGTYIGGPNAGDGNLILFNNQHGIELDDADNTIIQQNYIQNNVGDGIRMQASSGNGTVGVLVGSPTNTALGNIISGNANGINIMDAPSQKNQIRRNSIFCNGTARQNGINLNGLGNINIDIDPLVSISPWITAPNPGITGTFTNQSPLAGTDVIEVFYDNACGTCQGKTYLGDATSLNSPAAGDWSFSPLPAGSDCSPKGGASCLVGVQNITATRTDNLGNTSEFMTCTPVVMPVTFLYIEAKRFSSDEVLIDWATATETNNAYFELMRSIDGTTFVPVGRIQGAGNSSVVNKYSFTDQNLSSGMYYYMLQQVDVDGKRSLSDIRSVNLGPNDNLIEIVPTSLAQGDLVKVLNLSGNQIISLTLTDMTGKILVENRSLKSTESSINTSGYASGMYVVRVETSSAVIVKKIFIY